MKENIKKILFNKSFWKHFIVIISTILLIFTTYIIGFRDGLLVDNDIRTEFIERVNNDIINYSKDKNETFKKSLKPNVSINNIKSGLSNFKLNSRLFNYSTFNMLVSSRTYNFINNVTAGQNAYKVSNVVSFDSTNFTIGNSIYESIHCDIYILFRPYSNEYYLKASVWDNINNVSIRSDTILDGSNSSTGNSSFLVYFFSNNIIDNSNTTFLLSSYPSYISSPTFTGDFVTADIENNNSNFVDYFFVTFGVNSSDAYDAGYNAGYNDFANSDEYLSNLEQAYQNGIYVGYESGIIEGKSDFINSQEYRDILTNKYNEGIEKGKEIRDEEYLQSQSFFDSIWNFLRDTISTTLSIFDFHILPGIPLYFIVLIPILIGLIYWLFKLLSR